MQNTNILTFDVEDYYHILYRNFFQKDIDPSQEVVRCTDIILHTLGTNGTKATFFVVGKVAEKYPGLVKRIDDAGHEIASHGYAHIYVNQVTSDRFAEDLMRSRDVIRDITGRPPIGFRAPEFSIDHTTPWAFEILAKLGFRYDSSMFPGRNCIGNQLSTRPSRITTTAGPIMEIPLSTVSVIGRTFPAAGGGFLRLLPFHYNRWAIDRINNEGQAAVVYMHPYEFETNPQPINFGLVDLKQRIRAGLMHARQLLNRGKSLYKLERLLSNYPFTSISNYMGYRNDSDPMSTQ